MADSTSSDWQAAHEALLRLARTRAGLDFEEGQWLLAAHRSRAHERLGYGGFVEYIERLFGAPRLTYEKLRVAEALESLPELGQALREGAVSWSCVRELTRVATPETEATWLAGARGRTVRDVEKLVSGHRPGSLPDDPVEPSAERHVLRFEVSGEVLATFRAAMTKIRTEAGGPLDDDAALLLLARQVLAGPSDDGRASYQLELSVCEQCRRTHQVAQGELVEVSAEVAAMVRCDAQQLASPHVGFASPHMDEAREAVDRSREARVDTKTATAPTRKRQARAAQTVPPSVRRAVLRRDRHCCQVPGCRHVGFVDIHHVQAREDGGAHDPDNLVTLCAAHHRACHRGELLVQGRVSSGLCFRHADGTEYGGTASVTDADVQTRAFRALRNLGFREREVRRALAEVTAELGHLPELEATLRAALERLTGELGRAA
jgi:5-methylcytosine-specific restriction endonuclease McrA